MNAPTETILKKGYILIPKSMIEDFFKTGSQTEGYLEAWIQVLTRVNYSDTEVCVQGNRIVCRRGETVYTYKQWEKTLLRNVVQIRNHGDGRESRRNHPAPGNRL